MFFQTFFGKLFILVFLTIHLFPLVDLLVKNRRKNLVFSTLAVSAFTAIGFVWAIGEAPLSPITIFSVLGVGSFAFVFMYSQQSLSEKASYELPFRLPGNPLYVAFILSSIYSLGLGWLIWKLYYILGYQVEWFKLLLLSTFGGITAYLYVFKTYSEMKKINHDFHNEKNKYD